ncbi:MAG: response regulator [Chloroflexi bacterium]|nr:response regulator [Chloroflexota bacterium]
MKGVILLVEDNPHDVALTERALKKANVANELVVARDGVEALDYLGDCDPEKLPTVVLLDLKLPKVDGLEVLRHIRSSEGCRHLPVVVLTSSREEKDLIDSYNLGANSYVRKPVNFNEFAEAIQQLGLYWLVLNEPPPTIGGR